MIPRRVRVALLSAFLLHGLFILTARYRLSYDAYTHMFFADHYARDWWSLWEARWFGGFEIVSYPPLVHQITALLSHVFGVDAAYALWSWAVLTAYPLGVYAFCRIFCGRSASGFAALGAALLPSIYYSAYAFGQLPTLTATLFALFGLAALAEFLRSGTKLSGALAVSLMTIVMASHHATLLFLPWAAAAVVVHILLNDQPDRSALFRRLVLCVVFSVTSVLLVIWPFWAWGTQQALQTPIDHLSRHNFLTDHFAFVAFFLPMYGPLIVFIPCAIWMARTPRFLGLFLAFCSLLLLGLGGTTPLPRWLFGASWEWLTYDRFAFWASLLLLPFFGTVMVMARRWIPGLFTLRTEMIASHSSKPLFRWRAQWKPRRWAAGITLGVFALVALIAGLIPNLAHTQPEALNMQPIVDFLAADARSDWRYLTFGFGDQLAYLSRLTDATTIDGTYFTARTLPELRGSGIGQIDMALWSNKGLAALDPILQKSGERGVRWGFVNRKEYAAVLRRNGWVRGRALSNGIQVWENPQARLPQPSPAPLNPLAAFSWGTLPLLAFFLTLALAGLRFRPVRAQIALLGIHTIAVGLLPVSLVFWYYGTLTDIQHSLVYFSYDNALFFISDALALSAFLSWFIQREFGASRFAGRTAPKKGFSLQHLFSSARPWFFAVCLLASLSIFWSQDWRISLFVSLHLWLVYGLYLSLQERPELSHSFALGSCAALTLQALFGFWQFAIQSTAMMTPLGLKWLPALVPALSGVSVVQLLDGTRLLRIYGSLPHPNILAGILLAFLPGTLVLYLNSARRSNWLVILFGATAALLILTFSRAAWIGFAAAASFLAVRHRLLDRKRLLTLAFSGLFGLLAAVIPLRAYVFMRVTNAPVHTEQGSWQSRSWLIERAFVLIKQHPLLGVGIGAHTLASAQGLSPKLLGAPDDFLVEPVHSIPLLAQSELGVAGSLLLLGLGITFIGAALRARRANTIIFSAALLGLGTMGLFDHFLWTLAPGRLLFGLLLGLWSAQIKSQESQPAA